MLSPSNIDVSRSESFVSISDLFHSFSPIRLWIFEGFKFSISDSSILFWAGKYGGFFFPVRNVHGTNQ